MSMLRGWLAPSPVVRMSSAMQDATEHGGKDGLGRLGVAVGKPKDAAFERTRVEEFVCDGGCVDECAAMASVCGGRWDAWRRAWWGYVDACVVAGGNFVEHSGAPHTCAPLLFEVADVFIMSFHEKMIFFVSRYFIVFFTHDTKNIDFPRNLACVRIMSTYTHEIIGGSFSGCS
jgi:hypothetical protein